jgi:hypothetical protein
MPNVWQEEFIKLQEFIVNNSEIIIEKNRVRGPTSVKNIFYQLFRAVRIAFVKINYPKALNEANNLSKNYLLLEEEVTRHLSLDEISMLPILHRFLHSPIDQLIEGLFDPLFDLLKENVSVKEYTTIASKHIDNSFKSLYHLGYEKWTVLSLVNLLGADDIFTVISPNRHLYDAHKLGGVFKEEAPNTIQSRSIIFKYAPDPVFLVPDLILRLDNEAKFISFRSQLVNAFGIATNASDEREWLTTNSIITSEPCPTLVYIGDNIEDVSLVADANKICRPDIIIISEDKKDWHEIEEVGKIELFHATLQPKLGTYVITREQVPDKVKQGFGRGINLITVGFDKTKLKSIVHILMVSDQQKIKVYN